MNTAIKILKCTTFGIIAACLFAFSGADCSARDAGEKGYVFNLHNREFGNEILSVANNGVYLNMLDWGVKIVASSPKWDLVAFSESQKTFCELGDPTVQGRFGLIRPRRKLPPPKPMSVKGLHVLSSGLPVRLQSEEGPGWLGTFASGREPGGKKPARVVAWQLEWTDELKLSPTVGDTVCRMFSVYAVPGIPVECCDVLADGSKRFDWSMERWRAATVKSTDFAVPVGYKQMASVEQLFNKQVSHQMEDMFHDFDVENPVGGAKKPEHK